MNGTVRAAKADVSLPPSPVYIFRGHKAEITQVIFYNDDNRLVTGYVVSELVVAVAVK